MANNGEGEQTQVSRHQEVGHKSLLQSDAVFQVNQISFFRILHNNNILFLNLLCLICFLVYPGDQCLPTRARVHEGAQGSDSKASMVGSTLLVRIQCLRNFLLGFLLISFFLFIETGTS